MKLAETLLSPRLLLLTLGGDTPLTSFGANALAYSGPEGTLLVDPLIAPAHAALVEAAVAARGFAPVRQVVLTHHHTDHALGAGYFAARGATVIAHRRAAALMAEQHAGIVADRRADRLLAALFADAEPHVPGVLFDTGLSVDLGGGSQVRIRHLGAGHTPGDAVVIFAGEATVAAGDLVYRGYHFNYEEADREGLARGLAALHGLAAGGEGPDHAPPVTRFVPGHGPPGGPEILTEQARYHARVAGLVAGASGPDEAREAIRAAYPGHALASAIESALAARWPAMA